MVLTFLLLTADGLLIHRHIPHLSPNQSVSSNDGNNNNNNNNMMDPGAVPITTTTTPPTTTTPTTDTFPSSGALHSTDTPAAAVQKWAFVFSQRFQHLLDKSTPFLLYRWIGFCFVAIIYTGRVFFIQGFYVVSYALGIYILNLLIGFLSPQVDPEFQDAADGPTLPNRSSDEFRPFVRRLPEFKFWYSITKAFCIAFVLTFFSAFDVPVFWPILLFYWVILFTLTMKKQILHMVKYKYVPFSFGKQRYDGKRANSSETSSLLPRD